MKTDLVLIEVVGLMCVVACGMWSGVTARETVCRAAGTGVGDIRGVHSAVSASSADGQASLLMRNVKVSTAVFCLPSAY